MSENTTIQRSEEAIAEETSGRPTVAPAVDIYENAAGYLVLADLPGVRGDAMWFHTTNDAPKGRIIAIDLRKDGPEAWFEAVPETDAGACQGCEAPTKAAPKSE